MNSFKQFGIKVKSKSFVGDKVKMSKILNKEIIVHDYKIEDSKIPSYHDRGAGKCLCLQIENRGEKCIVFTSSSGLLEAIQQVPDTDFPFSTTIIQENDRFKFT
jgi:hypothetical protein